MKVGLCTIAFQELSLEKVLDIAKEYGFDGVEIWGKAPHIPDKYDPAYTRAIPRMARERGLEIISFGSYVNPLMEDYQRHWDVAFKIAQDLDTKLMRVWSGGGASKSISPENKALIISRFKEMCVKAEKLGIILATEMHSNNFTDMAGTILELLKSVGHPNLKTYYQPRFAPDADDPYKAAEIIGEYVVVVHAQNVKPTSDGKMVSCGVAEGIVNYEKVLQILKSKGFDGDLEVEFVYGEDKLASLKQDRDFLVKLAH